ncbi:hypothetical protein PAAG_05963 [Paracoccidioides lutzii Pb01]|uniref:DASH complex subunit SPC34 n=1 Tax=Paracoccidioides lutzii (strain ATCC MYA-826 / Pb01) TaxID=502779 RepID=C1H5C2_PARBA|nr:hypothetical protein PAAG_05963 [Paracoccidioides lutzii Pb01]EEH34916.2 hypothetical protein PAAG_05963 [Paracoccidioides lutzii Pb01]
MGLLESHLEQISLSAAAIADLPFPPPKIFANAMLKTNDITSLIRDTEPHERALFSVDPFSDKSNSSRHCQRRATRRATAFTGSEIRTAAMGPTGDGRDSMASRIYAAKHNKNHFAVVQVLGGEMLDEIRKTTGATSSSSMGEIDVDVLLRGAEMLCNVYPIAGAKERISSLRQRHVNISDSIALLEARIAEQSAQLERMNRSQQSYSSSNYDDDYENDMVQSAVDTAIPVVTDEDLRREMAEICELEERKRRLEERVTGMERDLGGLMR